MALDSESRWRLVRKAKATPVEPEGEIEVRAAKITDLGEILDIYNFYVKNSAVTFDVEPMSLADWREKFEWLSGLNMPFLVAATSNGSIIGFAYVAPWRQKAAYRRTVEDSIYLRPAAIGKRVGTRLMKELLAEAKAAGVREVVAVISDRGADASIQLHKSFGFKNQGHLAKVGFKFERWLGTILLQKSL